MRVSWALLLSFALVLVGVGVVYLQPHPPSIVVRVLEARVTPETVHPGDEVAVHFSYCKLYPFTARLVHVDIVGGGRVVTVAPSEFLMPDTALPVQCGQADFHVFRMPAATPIELYGLDVQADITFEFVSGKTRVYQGFRTTPFRVELE